MTITAIALLAPLASTSLATYGTFEDSARGSEDAQKSVLISNLQDKRLGGGMTAEQAKVFADRYFFIDQLPNVSLNGFSAAVFQERETGRKIFAMRGTEVPVFPDQTWFDLIVSDGSIGANGFANNQAVELIRYYRRLTTIGGQPVNYTEEQKWQLFAIANSLLVTAAVVVPFLSPTLQSSYDAFKQTLASDKGIVSPISPSGAVLSTSDVMDITGHSLGGHLAILFARFFPAATNEVVTLNAPGFFPQGNLFLTNLGYPPANNEAITRLEADGDGISEIGTIWPGRVIRFAQENDPGAVAAISSNHSSVNGVDGLNLMVAIAKLDATFADNAVELSKFFRSASNKVDNSYENLLDGLRKIILGTEVSPTPTYRGTDIDQRTPMYANTAALTGANTTDLNAFKKLSGKVTLQLTHDTDVAKIDFAAFISLQTGATFSLRLKNPSDLATEQELYAIHRTSYEQWLADKNLRRDGGDISKLNFSDEWIADRAALLNWRSKINTENIEGVQAGGNTSIALASNAIDESTTYYDIQTKTLITVAKPLSPLLDVKRITFGDAQANDISGGGKNDHLYGGAGNDTITAGKGNDHIEGGTGDDILLDGGEGNDKVLGGAGNDKLVGDKGNDKLIGGTGNDEIIGGDDADILIGGEGTDQLTAGSGNDILIGGTGDDTLDGGADMDFLNGGSGKDTLTGGQGNDYLYDQGGSGASEQSTLKGDGGNDILEVKGDDTGGSAGGAGITIIGGGADNDIILGNSTGSNSLDGDSGNDVITGGDEYDIINGGDGADNIEAGGGADLINGGEGADYLRGGASFDDYIYSTLNFGTDLIEDDNGSITVMGAALSGGSYSINRQAYLGDGYEYRQYTMGSMTLLGINRAGDTKNTIYLKDWTDGQLGIYLDGQEQETQKPPSSPITVESLAGNNVDFILGKDAADGGKGNDFLQGTAAQSVLAGGVGNDVLNGMAGDDWLEGGEGNDYISTGQGSDVAYGGSGNDVLTAYGTLSTDVCARQPSDLLTTQRFYYKDAGTGARNYIDHPRLAAFDFEIRPKPTTDTSGDLVFMNVGMPSPSLEAGTVLSLDLGETYGVERGDSVALSELQKAKLGTPIFYPFQLASNSALQATGQKGVRLWGGSGNDIIYGAGDSDKLYGQADNDVLVGFGGDDALYGGDGKDELSGGDGRDFLDGGDDESADALFGGMGADVIHGGDGDDKLVGDLPYLKGANGYPPGTDTKLMGGDYLSGGAGKDKIWGDAGDDYLDGGTGDDKLYGGLDDDHLFGGENADDLSGGKGNDFLDGGAGKDNLFELDEDGEGADILYGRAGDDTLDGGKGDDILDGGDDNDVMTGGDGNDILRGGDGIDTLYGDGGAGKPGDDILEGGVGNDKLNGGGGSDMYVFAMGDGQDRIQDDGSSGSRNTIVFKFSYNEVHRVQRTGLDLVVSYGANGANSVTVAGFYGGGFGLGYQPGGITTQMEVAPQAAISIISFEDGEIWDEAKILLLAPAPAESEVEPDPFEQANLPYFVNALLERESVKAANKHALTYSFAQTGDSSGFALYTAEHKQAVRAALAKYSDVLDLSFTEVASSESADLQFFMDDLTSEDAGAFAGYASPSSGEIHLNSRLFAVQYLDEFGNSASKQSLSVGQSGFEVLLHEIGHALGLKHPFESPQLPYAENSNANTLMSYTRTQGPATELAMFDVAALQYLYGVATDKQLGDNSYTLDQRYISDASGIDTLDASAQTQDVFVNLQAGGWSHVGEKNESILAAGQSFIGFGTMIENAIGGSGNDTLEGNDLVNTLTGGLGNDTLFGGKGNDQLIGGEGADRYAFNLGDGKDVITDSDSTSTLDISGVSLADIHYGRGVLLYGSQGDSVRVDMQSINSLVLGDRTYTKDELVDIFGAASVDADVVLSYQQSEGQLLGASDWSLTGNRFENNLLGNAGNNTLDGGAGDDVLIGGEGADSYIFKEGDGSDVIQDFAGNSKIVLEDVDANTVYHDGENLYYGDGLDKVSINAQEISELVINGVSYDESQIQALFGATSLQTSDSGDLTLRRYINHGELLGSGDWTLTGNDRDNTLTGNSGNNIIHGGAGADAMLSGAGDDTYLVAQTGDAIVENLNEGNDTVMASVDYSLSANVENLVLTGSAQNATGNELSNKITGNAQNNQIDGGSGDDQLTGGLGDDQLTGGIGSDLYIYRPGDGNDEIIDLNNDSQQTDELRLTGGILASQVSLLRLNQDILLSVNGSNSILLRNQAMGSGQGIERITFDSGEHWDAAQILDRATVIDSVERFQIGTNAGETLQGFAGNDVLLGRSGNDVLIGDSGNDQLMGGSGSDALYGGDGDDNLIDSDGPSLMDGGAGDDTYAIDTSQAATEINIRDLSGTDKLVLNWARDHIIVDAKTLTLTHRITGQIVKLPGLDQQQGGTGQQDASAIETITVLEGDGTSLQQQTLSWHQLFLGADAVVLGDTQNNQTTLGNSSASTALLGMTGDDVLTGGAGVEIFRPGSGNDRMEGAAGDDRYDVIGSSGNKIILDTHGNDSLVLGWNAEDLDFDLQTSSFFNKSTGQRVTLEGFDLMQDPPVCPIEHIQLANGETISAAEYFTRTFPASSRAVDGSLIGTGLNEEFISTGQGERIFSAGGNDRLNGSDGDDYLDGGTGADLMKGGSGSDTYIVDNIGDQIIDVKPTWSRSSSTFSNNLNELDTVISSVSFKLGDGLDNIVLTGNEAINATGNWLSNTLTGNSADNILIGSALSLSFESFGDISNFYNNGSSYTGTLYQRPGGNTGNTDLYYEGESSYSIRGFIDTNRNYFLNGIYDYWGASNNVFGYFSLLVDPNINYEISPNGTLAISQYQLPHLSLLGDTLYGGDGNDKLYGDIDDDTLDGGAGDDLLVSGGGSDVMIGGAGDDVYVLSNDRLNGQADVVLTELANGGSDTVITNGDWTLADNFENLVLGYNPATYDPYFNILYEQFGEPYPDLSLIGSEGLYRSYNSYRTSPTGKGNSLDNQIIVNNSAYSIVYGYAGNDTINNPWGASYGGDGDDQIDGSFAYGEAGNDTLRGWNLDGGQGADLMIGWEGFGNTYFVDNAGDVIVENEDEGIDTVHTMLNTPALQAHIENLVLIEGSTATVGVGNELSNHINGNSLDNVLDGGDGGDDTIFGGAGNDTLTADRGDDFLDGGSGEDSMYGGRGSDTYIVDNTMDQVIDDATDSGVDTVKSDVSWTLSDGVENLLLDGRNAINGTGNALGNYISGNEADNVMSGLTGNDIILGLAGNDVLDGGDGDDRLDGGTGVDTMSGGRGNDSFIVDSYSDVIIEEANAGHDHIDVYSAYVMSENIEDVTLHSDYLIANSSANQITASAGGYNYIEGRGGDDVIYGGDDALTSDYYGGTVLAYNDDTLFGNEGNDVIDGGSGSDYLYGGDGNDVLIGGADRVRLDTSAYIPPAQEQLNNGADPRPLEELIVVLGVLPNDDYLDGGAGIDEMRGGTGNDTYVVDGDFILNPDGSNSSINLCDEEHRFGMDRASRGQWIADTVIELEDQGYDTVYSSASIDLSAQSVERVYLDEMHPAGDLRNDLSASTGAGDQMLIGNSGNNRLDGGLGADFMAGDQGDDTYTVDDAGDRVVEYQGAGFDTVRTTLNDYTLAAELEGLVLEGAADLNGYGNDADNVLIGNSGANILRGGLGNDTLAGWRGNDVLMGGQGNDTYGFSRGDGVDRIVDSQGNNRLHLSGEITQADLRFRLNGNDLVITLTNDQGTLSNDSVILENWANTSITAGETRINRITFCGGASIVLDESMLNQAPVAVDDVAQIFEDGAAASGNVLTNDSDADGNAISVVNAGVFQGQYGSLTLQTDGSYLYTLDNSLTQVQSLGLAQTLSESFSYAVADSSPSGALADSASLNITIVGTNDGPVAQVDMASVQEEGIVTAIGNVLTNDSDLDAGTVLAVANGGSYQGTYGSLVLQANGSYSYTLNNSSSAVQSLRASQQVSDVFTLQTTDGFATVASSLTLNITGANDGPVVQADVATASEDGIVTASGNVLTNDRDVDVGDTLSSANAGTYQGTYGQLVLQANGSYAYNLANTSSAVQSLRAGQQVSDVFTLQTTDGIATVASNLTVSISGSNDGPIVQADVAAVSEDGIVTATGNVLTNDRDIDSGAVLSIANAGTYQGTYGSLTLQVNGSYSYSLNNSSSAVQSLAAGQQVQDSFQYTATDGQASTASQLVITITGSNDAPTLQTAIADQTAQAAQVFTLDLPDTTFKDIDQGDVVSYGVRLANGSALPSWLSFNPNGLIFTGTPPQAFAGQSLDIQITATDRSGASASDTFNVRIEADGGVCVGLTLVGTSGNDRLLGTACNDTLDGRQGADTMLGGAGDDLYYVDTYYASSGKGNEGVGNGEDPPPPGHDTNYNDGPGTSPGNPGNGNGNGGNSYASDIVSEYLNQGYDRVIATVGYVLPEHVEALTLGGSNSINGTGNTLDNWLTGNSASNSLDGKEGNDLISAGAGDDDLYGGTGNDILEGQDGADWLEGGDGRDALFGGAGNDTIKSNAGRGFLAGGRGNDALYVGTEATEIAFNKGDGSDTVYLSGSSPITLSLGGGIRYEDISIRRSGSDLYMDFNTQRTDSLRVVGYYSLSSNSRPSFTLQMLTEASGAFNANSTDVLRDDRAEIFDGTRLIRSFDTAYAASSSLRRGNPWAVMNSLLDAHLYGSDTAALGGDLAYQFGSQGSASLAGMGMAAAGSVISDTTFVTGLQTLNRPPALSSGPRLAG